MNNLKLNLTIAFILISFLAMAKSISLEGLVTEKHNRGFRMVGVKIEIINAQTNEVAESIKTNGLGVFKTQLSLNNAYRVKVFRKNFLPFVKEISTKDASPLDAIMMNVEMERKPGYVFDVTLTKGKEVATLAVLKGARIEVYNNTTAKSELELVKHKGAGFQFVFESGNYYTIMIRKKGYFNKRIEAYIDIDGCILCFDGLDIKGQELIGSTSHENKRGVFLADIKLQPIEVNKTIIIDNIYYDYNQANIRSDAAMELNKLTTILRDNQHVMLELGSHTDARGKDDYNLQLSNERAKAAVDYLTTKNGISADRLTSKGYGESQLLFACKTCTEETHQQNRRTELKIIGSIEDPMDKMSLKEIIRQGKKYELLADSE